MKNWIEEEFIYWKMVNLCSCGWESSVIQSFWYCVFENFCFCFCFVFFFSFFNLKIPTFWIWQQTQLFGIPSLEGVDTLQLQLPKLETILSAQVHSVIQQIRSQRSTYQHLQIVREGEPRETKFFSYFVDDRSRSVHSYNEFLTNLYQRVQAKLQNS